MPNEWATPRASAIAWGPQHLSSAREMQSCGQTFVVGVTMKVWPQDCISRAEDKCCGPQAIADARGVAHSLGIPHYVVDEADQFERVVIDYFSSEYQAGRTPNPCVMCNEKLKFGNLW